MAITTKRPRDLSEYIDLVSDLQKRRDTELWFRGIGKLNYKLEPSLYRHKEKTDLVKMQQLEKNIIVRFKERAIPFHERSFTDEWDLLFFMQHHGVPTRLLDWSENPFIGLYFAIASAVRNRRQKLASSCVVWILDPAMWNNCALSKQGYDRGILTSSDDQ